LHQKAQCFDKIACGFLAEEAAQRDLPDIQPLIAFGIIGTNITQSIKNRSRRH
jgi:hypothetical protein